MQRILDYEQHNPHQLRQNFATVPGLLEEQISLSSVPENTSESVFVRNEMEQSAEEDDHREVRHHMKHGASVDAKRIKAIGQVPYTEQGNVINLQPTKIQSIF